MNVTEAVRAARRCIIETFGEEKVTDIGLEEVEFEDGDGVWRITIGFVRPWRSNERANERPNAFANLLSKRIYKIVRLADDDGRVRSIRHREIGAE